MQLLIRRLDPWSVTFVLNEDGPSLYKRVLFSRPHIYIYTHSGRQSNKTKPLFYFPASFLSMLSGISKHLFGAYPALLFLGILAGHQSCSARKNSTVYCAPSCGNIHISYPFRLSTDPNNSCGNKRYELICENNRPALYLNKVKYYVQAIDYSNFTIRVVDADVQKDDCFSIPSHSLIEGPFNDMDYYFSYDKSTFVFMSCRNPIPSPPDYIVDASSCKNGSSLFNSTSNTSSPSSHNMEGTYSYVFIAYPYTYYLRDIPDLCHVNLMYHASFTFLDQPTNETNIISYKDVHDSLLYGFDLSWSGSCCDFLKENPCKFDKANISVCGTLLSLSLSLSVSLTHTHTHTHKYLNNTQFADKKRKIMRCRLS